MFVQLSSGIARRTFDYRNVQLNNIPFAEQSETEFIYGGGIGFDLNVAKFFTLTSMAAVRTGSSPLPDLVFGDEDAVSTSITSYQLALQATLRFNHKRY